MLKPVASAPGTITISFATKTIFLEKEGATESVETIELVKPGQLLALLTPCDDTTPPAPGQQKKPPTKHVILTPGDHTQLSVRGDSLLATVAGYPKVSKITNANEETLTISITPLVTISQDQMEASLTSIFSLEVDPREAALREAEEAIGLVLRASEPVELSPQNAYIRRLQHQMAERANLISRSRGREPYRRVRLYP